VKMEGGSKTPPGMTLALQPNGAGPDSAAKRPSPSSRGELGYYWSCSDVRGDPYLLLPPAGVRASSSPQLLGLGGTQQVRVLRVTALFTGLSAWKPRCIANKFTYTVAVDREWGEESSATALAQTLQSAPLRAGNSGRPALGRGSPCLRDLRTRARLLVGCKHGAGIDLFVEEDQGGELLSPGPRGAGESPLLRRERACPGRYPRQSSLRARLRATLGGTPPHRSSSRRIARCPRPRRQGTLARF